MGPGGGRRARALAHDGALRAGADPAQQLRRAAAPPGDGARGHRGRAPRDLGARSGLRARRGRAEAAARGPAALERRHGRDAHQWAELRVQPVDGRWGACGEGRRCARHGLLVSDAACGCYCRDLWERAWGRVRRHVGLVASAVRQQPERHVRLWVSGSAFQSIRVVKSSN